MGWGLTLGEGTATWWLVVVCCEGLWCEDWRCLLVFGGKGGRNARGRMMGERADGRSARWR